MIIFQTTIGELKENIDSVSFFKKIKDEYTLKVGRRPSDGEAMSWTESIGDLTKIINKTKIHDDSQVLIEYQLPISNKRIDVVICGKNKENKDTALVIELKRWEIVSKSTTKDMVTTNAGGKNLHAHPSLQALTYSEDLQDFDSNFETIELISSSYLHNYLPDNDRPLIKYYFDIVKKAPLFSKKDEEEFITFLNDHLSNGRSNLAYEIFKNIKWQPNESFIARSEKFEKKIDLLLENTTLYSDQKIAYRVIIDNIEDQLNDNKKNIFIINGASGTGKTVVALKLFLKLINNNSLMMFPGTDFRNTITNMFDLKNKENPLRNKIKGQPTKGAWLKKNEVDTIIVDESHKLPENSSMSGIKPLLDICEKINNIILLFDEKQITSKKNMNTLKLLDKVKSHNMVRLDLKNQFRSQGGNNFIEWLDDFLYKGVIDPFNNNDKFSVDFFENENDFIISYKNSKISNKRLLTLSTSFPWTRKIVNGKPVEDIKISKESFMWYIPQQKTIRNKFENIEYVDKEYVDFDFNLENGHDDFVGYYNTVQGSEFEEVWIYIGDEVFRNANGYLDIDENKFKNGNKWDTLWSINTKDQNEANERHLENVTLMMNRIRILATRARKSVKLFFKNNIKNA